MQYLTKPVVLSEYEPENTNVLWAQGDISNRNNISITSLKQYINGSWKSVLPESD